jgi:hypothetical protein
MPSWEYCTIDLNNLPARAQPTDLLNDAGDHGWELVSITANSIAYLKREIGSQAIAKPSQRKVPLVRVAGK